MNPRQDSWSRVPKGSHATRRRRALDHDLARLHNRAPEGWPPFAGRTPPLTLRRLPRSVGRRDRVRAGADVAGRPKEDGQRPVRYDSPGASYGERKVSHFQSAQFGRGASA